MAKQSKYSQKVLKNSMLIASAELRYLLSSTLSLPTHTRLFDRTSTGTKYSDERAIHGQMRHMSDLREP